MNKLDRLFTGSPSGSDYAKRYAANLSDLLANLDIQAIEKVVEEFLKARDGGNTIFFVGNGGSAATCSHFAEDLALGTFINEDKPIKALSLTDNNVFITALGNDEGYDNAFVGQLRALFNTGDILVAISGSGNSPNLLKAVEYANKKMGITVGITGFDGGKLKNICRYCVNVETGKGEYAPVEDIHLAIGHIISTYLVYKMREE